MVKFSYLYNIFIAWVRRIQWSSTAAGGYVMDTINDTSGIIMIVSCKYNIHTISQTEGLNIVLHVGIIAMNSRRPPRLMKYQELPFFVA
jgi:hypothetical protein